jgi:hypothetical protein
MWDAIGFINTIKGFSDKRLFELIDSLEERKEYSLINQEKLEYVFNECRERGIVKEI